MPKNPIKKKRLEKKLKKLMEEGRLVKGVVIPKGSLAGDPDKQNRGNGYAAKFYYVDISFFCKGCGNKEVWTAKQQNKLGQNKLGHPKIKGVFKIFSLVGFCLNYDISCMVLGKIEINLVKTG